MCSTTGTLIGHVIDVRDDGLTANLLADEQDAAPKITVGDEDVLVGQLGSYVSVRQGSVRILCIVTRVSEQEKLADANTASPEAPIVTYAQRTIALIPIGSVSTDGQFERGVSSYVKSLVPEGERGLVDILAGLGRGECLALGEAVPLPTRFKFNKPSPFPNSEDIDFFNKWKDGPDDINVESIVDRWRKQQR